jgi:hypothetical protein
MLLVAPACDNDFRLWQFSNTWRCPPNVLVLRDKRTSAMGCRMPAFDP